MTNGHDGGLTAADLKALVAETVEDYAARAESFREGTAHHDVAQNIAALLDAIEGSAPYALLDLGCGPGRDLQTFTALGHRAVGLDATPEFVALAHAASGCPVWQQDFLDLRLPAGAFDGIFANASLFHVPSQELPRVLGDLHAALKPRGVLFSSNPRGHGEEGWSGGRYGVWHDLTGWRRYCTAAGFVEIRHYYRPPGLPRDQQPWLASVWRRSEPPAVRDRP